MKHLTIRNLPLLAVLVVLVAACSTPPTGGDVQPKPKGVPRIAVLLTADDLAESTFAKDILIGVSRTAQEFGGTILGREETIAFGEEVEFQVIPTAFDRQEIEKQLHELDIGQYDLVFTR